MFLGKFLNFRTKYRLLLWLQQFKKPVFFKPNSINPAKNHAFIFLAADYGNLGDVAITYAQTLFLEEHLPDHQVIEIPISKSLEGLWFVKRNIKKNDLVTTVGGGNLGEMYVQIEFIRQLVVRFFPSNKIISFPQTFDFSHTPKGIRALKQAKRVYDKHKHLFWVTREKVSFELMKKNFNTSNVLLSPDIVLTLNKTEPKHKRDGLVFCMRNDKEKKLSASEHEILQKLTSGFFKDISCYDTGIERNQMSKNERLKELEKIWEVFRRAELVITDRLHGMIFCYITNTPCLVFSNSNHKIKATYQWIKNCKSITLINIFNEKLVKQIFQEKNFIEGKWESLNSNYKSIEQILRN
jgi:pyruvyl transferase EpsI